MAEAVLFYLFAALAVGGGLLTITRRNAVHAAVWLTASLLGVAGLFLLLGAEFVFLAQIIVYIGGITLLFLFVIMLVNLDLAAHIQQFRKTWPIAAILCSALVAELILLLKRQHVSGFAPAPAFTIEALSDVLLSKYAVPFELASVLLLAAIVGSVWMGQQRSAK